MKNRAAPIGLIVGIVFVTRGFAYSNAGVWMLGVIFPATGVFSLRKK